jgi:hypothetical protein
VLPMHCGGMRSDGIWGWGWQWCWAVDAELRKIVMQRLQERGVQDEVARIACTCTGTHSGRMDEDPSHIIRHCVPFIQEFN